MKQINKEDFIYHETEESGLSKINDNFSEVEVELEKKAKLNGGNTFTGEQNFKNGLNTKADALTNWMNFWKEGETNRIDSYNDSSGFQDLYIRTKNAIFEIGNLGIGTSNPTKKLEVNGETLSKGIYSEHTGQYWSGTFQSSLADKSKRWLFGIRGGTGSSKFSFQHYNGSAWLGDLLTLLGSDGGRVGIGQNNPTEKLDVNGIIKTNGLTLSSIPSSPAGLSSGMVYRDGNNLKIIP